MKIRLEGTLKECQTAAAVLREVVQVQEASKFYPNRGDSNLGRVYLEIRLIHPKTGEIYRGLM